MTRLFHILGPGAMGCLWAARLKSRGVQVCLLSRKPPPSTNNKATIKVTEAYRTKKGNARASPTSTTDYTYEAEVDIEQSDGKGPPINNLLVMTKAYDAAQVVSTLASRLTSNSVMTKAYDAAQAVSSLASRLTSQSVIILLSNGMGPYEEMKANPRLKHLHHYVLGTTTHGAFMSSPFNIMHTGFGESYFGLPTSAVADYQQQQQQQQQQAFELESLLLDLGQAQMGAQYEPSANITRRLWLKLAVNACINPITALLRCPNGRIVQDPSLREMLHGLCDEVAQVAAIQFSKGVSSSSSSPLSSEELEAFVMAVARQTALNQSSMLRDILANRNTEVDYINGYLVRLGRELGSPTPRHETLLHLIHALEQEQKRPPLSV